jgi:hypothetical protein
MFDRGAKRGVSHKVSELIEIPPTPLTTHIQQLLEDEYELVEGRLLAAELV